MKYFIVTISNQYCPMVVNIMLIDMIIMIMIITMGTIIIVMIIMVTWNLLYSAIAPS